MRNHRAIRAPRDVVRMRSAEAGDHLHLNHLSLSALWMVPVVAVSTVLTAVLATVEVILLASPMPALRVVAYLLISVHGAYAFNMLWQARNGLGDYWRALRGRQPRTLTAPRMAQAKKSSVRLGWLSLLLMMANPFFPVALWTVVQVLALQADTVSQHAADISEEQHRIRKSGNRAECAPVSERESIKASRAVVLGQARRNLLSIG